jgi:hypothetical protein
MPDYIEKLLSDMDQEIRQELERFDGKFTGNIHFEFFANTGSLAGQVRIFKDKKPVSSRYFQPVLTTDKK